MGVTWMVVSFCLNTSNWLIAAMDAGREFHSCIEDSWEKGELAVVCSVRYLDKPEVAFISWRLLLG